MQVRLMVERGQDECVVKLAGMPYKFKRNEQGHLITDVSDVQTIQWVSDPRNSSFLPYNVPRAKAEVNVIDEGINEEIGASDTPTEPSEEMVDVIIDVVDDPPEE